MTMGDEISGGLRDVRERLARGETIAATSLRTCQRCEGVGYWLVWYSIGQASHTCPNCGGTGVVREKVELRGR